MNNKVNRKRQRRGRQNPSLKKALTGISERLPYHRNDEDSLLEFRGLIVPDHYYTHLNYDEFSLTILSTAATGIYVYRGNCCFDPNFTGVGAQPVGFDQLTALWSRFKVHGSRIEVKLIQCTQIAALSVTPSLVSSTPSSMQVSLQTPYNVNMMIPSTVPTNNLKLTKYIETRKIFGYPNIFQDDVFAGSGSSSPNHVFFWVLNAATFDEVTTATMRVNVKITYDIEFYNRVNLSQSLEDKDSQC
jgi:hypothetical protein